MNEYMLAFFAKNIVMSRCPSLYQSNMLAYTHTHTQLQSLHSSPLSHLTNQCNKSSPNILAAFYLPIKDSASSSSLVMNFLNYQ